MTSVPVAGVRRILVVELLGGFGDLLIALPAVHALALSHPGARVTVVTFAPGSALLAADPLVHEVVETSDHTPGEPARVVARVLARGGWDLAVTTTTYGGIAQLCRDGAAAAVTDLWAGAPAGDRVDRRFLRLLVDAGAVAREHADAVPRVHVEPRHEAAGADLLDVAGVGPGGVLLVPGAGMAVKRWPPDRWGGLARRLTGEGRDVSAIPDGSVPGVPGVPALPAQDLPGLAGTFSALARRGGTVVGGDTGPVRLAASAGARVVALFGPSPAGRYGMPGGRAVNLQGLPGCAVRRPSALTEQECWWHGCPLATEPACLADVTIERVVSAVLDGRVPDVPAGVRRAARPATPAGDR